LFIGQRQKKPCRKKHSWKKHDGNPTKKKRQVVNWVFDI
jgi:hypothetical protein